MNRRRHRHESTAYHEAGHAVAAFVLGLKIGRRGVSIVPDKSVACHEVAEPIELLRNLRASLVA